MSRPTRRVLAGAATGALVSLALWASDLAGLASLRFAGVSDARVQERVVSAASAALAGLELRLVVLHLVAGLAAGALWVAGWPAARASLARAVFVSGPGVLLLHVLAFGGMLVRYPQLYADRYWTPGGVPARLMRLATHGLGPWPFDLLLAALVLGLAGSAAWRALRSTRARAALGAAALVVALLVAWRGDPRPRPARAGAPASVLILATDSLRSDRIEQPDVMPFTASLVARGRLYPHAFTAVARTVPSWVSLLTGLEPRRTDVRTMFPRREPLAALAPSFVSLLRDRGYSTFVASDFAGDMFPRFDAGFETVDTPYLTVDALARATALSGHSWSLPALRLGPLRRALPEWRNLATLSDPAWLADDALALLARAGARPFVGVVFFSTSHFPFVAPWPDYRRGADGYTGRYLYDSPPSFDTPAGPEDVAQIRARYDGALHAVDRAIARLVAALERGGRADNTLLVVMGDHGEDLFEQPGLFGHGDVLGMRYSQLTPILLLGPGITPGRAPEQVRLLDLGATLLGAIEGQSDRSFGDGVSLLADRARPLCVETGAWFWPDRPPALRGRRLEYPPVSELVEILPGSRELGMRLSQIPLVESAKDRGLVLGRRYWHEQLTPAGRVAELVSLPGIPPRDEDVDLAALFESRCVEGDPRLRRFFDAVVYPPPPP